MKQIDLKGVQSVVSQWPRNYRLLTVQQHCGSIEISLRQVPLDNDTHTCTIQHLYGSLGAVFPYTQRRQLSNESPVSNLAPIGSSTRASRKIHHARLPRQKSTLVKAAVQPIRSLVQDRKSTRLNSSH